MAEGKVLLSLQDSIAMVELNNPERHNALSRQVVEELARTAERLSADPSIRVVILSGGTAKSFCAGADLKERAAMDESEVAATVGFLRQTVDRYARLPMPVIAAVHGMAFGGGCELALAADIRLLAESALMGLTELSLAIIPGAGGCARLPQVVGPAKAKELIFTARRLKAPEALALGLANQVVPDDDLLTAAWDMAHQIAQQGPLAVRAAKRAINGATALDAALALEWEAYQSIIPTRDRREGLAAFLAKRPPVYRGE